MNKAKVKAVVVFDRRASSWFSEKIIDDCSIDYYLMDIEEFLLDIQIFDRVLAIRHEEHALDAVLLDAALPDALLMKIAMRVRDQMPGLPVLLLPQFNVTFYQAYSAEEQARITLPQADASTFVRAICYAHNRQRLQHKLLKLALKDDLTGLHNRRGFIALAKQHLRLARSMKRTLLLFFADLDGLKQINDQFGHHAGDQALTLTAVSLRKTFRRSDITARLGGDEFVALLMEEPGRSAATIRERLQTNLAKYAAKKGCCPLSLSVGMARFNPEAPLSLQALMAQADADLYTQKRQQQLISPVSVVATTPKPRGSRKIDITRLSKQRLNAQADANGDTEPWVASSQLELNAPGGGLP